MIIAIVGTGYVGLVTGTCLANTGHIVYCIDINADKINKLNSGIIPIYEPGLEELIKKNIEEERLFFTTSYDIVSEADAVFSAVGTPPDEDGSADLKYVLAVAKEFGKRINKRAVFINKSTVPVGTSKKVENVIKQQLEERRIDIKFDVVSNPEFLKEGSAIKDFSDPDRIVIGASTAYARAVMSEVYNGFNQEKLIFMDVPSAEMTKYAANAMLATRISFMNDIANLCDKVGANVKNVKTGIGYDTRIGNKFLDAGCGYGGSCFPKDVKALIKTADDNGYSMEVLKAVERVNNSQKHILYKNVCKAIEENNIDGPIDICVIGTAFKPNTDDMREATSVVLLHDLLASDLDIYRINVWDPIALNECKRIIGQPAMIHYYEDIDDAMLNADILIVVTEWNEIKKCDLHSLKRKMTSNIIIDGRNVFDKSLAELNGFVYYGIGVN